MSDSVCVRGAASAEEIAAVIAALHVVREPPEAGYARWRRQRLAALRSSRSITVTVLLPIRGRRQPARTL